MTFEVLYRCDKCQQERVLYGDSDDKAPSAIAHYCQDGSEDPALMRIRFITEKKETKE